MDPSAFFSKLRPEAERLAQLIGAGANAVPVFLAQWANETGFESPNWIGGNNFSGLTNGGPPNFQLFASAEEHTRAQAAALMDPDYSSNYSPFLQAARENAPPALLAEFLGLSGWDANFYRGSGTVPGEQLMALMDAYELKPSAQSPTPTSGAKPADPPKEQTWLQSIGAFFAGINSSVFSWDWWKRSLWLLIILAVAMLLIYFSLRGMTNPPATQGEGD